MSRPREPLDAVMLAIDPGACSGWAVMHHGNLVGFGTVKGDDFEGRDLAVRVAVRFASGEAPVMVAIEKFGAGVGGGRFFGARTLAGIERRVGSWIDTVLRAGIPRTRIVRVLPHVWRKVVLGKMSPDCTHFSKAKGGKPRSKGVRSLAEVAHRWAAEVRPRVIALENVEEFEQWGPLTDEGLPCPVRKGETFRAWVAALEARGYVVEWRVLRACDYGAPTSRKRLFLVARCDGRQIVWPEPTHGPGRARPWRTAAECIDWSIPCPSIFDRKRPLAEPTLRRIATGLRRYVLEAARTFIVPVTHPRDGRVHSIDEPLRTVTAANRGELALVAPTLVQTGYGERPGQTPRALDLGKPLGTVVAGGGRHALVAAWLTKHYGGVVGHELDRPLGTVTTQDHHSLTTAELAPLGGDRRAEVRAFLVKYYGAEGSSRSQQSLFEPLHTVTTKARFGLVTVEGVDYEIADIGMRMLAPRELFRAQGFPDSYQIELEHDGKPLTKTAQIALAGNSVCPPLAAAIVGANLDDRRAVAA